MHFSGVKVHRDALLAENPHLLGCYQTNRRVPRIRLLQCKTLIASVTVENEQVG
jgi:hypothetical protein